MFLGQVKIMSPNEICLIIVTLILKNIPKILKNIPKILKKSSKMHIKFQNFEKILQIAYLVPKMNSPWLEYEKWYITSWYTVKSDFCQILPDFSGKTGFRIRWTGYPIQKFICVKTYLVQSKYYPNISAKLVK